MAKQCRLPLPALRGPLHGRQICSLYGRSQRHTYWLDTDLTNISKSTSGDCTVDVDDDVGGSQRVKTDRAGR